jgi:hypothetical protein
LIARGVVIRYNRPELFWPPSLTWRPVCTKGQEAGGEGFSAACEGFRE